MDPETIGTTPAASRQPAREGRLVRLRDATVDDVDVLEALVWEQGGFNDFGLAPAPVDRAALALGPLRSEEKGLLLVERVADGRPVGTVSWRRVRYGPNSESACWNFGVELLREARGQGLGTEAQALLVDYLFATTIVNRVEASTDIDNVAEQRALENAGLRREGIIRGSQFRAGRYHDLVQFALVRGDTGG